MTTEEYERLYGWRSKWKWPWAGDFGAGKQRNPLAGLARMAARLKRSKVWVYRGEEKWKRILKWKRP